MERTILVVGLGNFGKEYENTLHNMGFMAIDRIAKEFSKTIKKAECRSLTSTFQVNGNRVVLAKPLTYMNLSGEAVKSLVSKYKVAIEDIIILYDDVYIDRYTIRVREFGSAGTHKGMKNIIDKMQTQKIKRVRFGVGEGPGILTDYVLSPISSKDLKTFDKVFDVFAESFAQYLYEDNFSNFMQTNNAWRLED
ncbi:MAG TPA: aminoacyl-tRNA hydrolase [Clostridiales bacterium]|nr:aminoacyl-tRNA hydrolase [Clostridiales bacterium]